MPQIVNLDSLQRTATKYDPVLRNLPSILLQDFISTTHFNLQYVDVRDVRVNLWRKGALVKPYTGTVTGLSSETELVKAVESELEVKTGYLALVDQIQNYRKKDLLAKAGTPVSDNRGNHPLENVILENIVKTFIEDFTYSIYFAQEGSGTNPLGVFDGVLKKIDKLGQAGEMAKAKLNLFDHKVLNPYRGEDDPEPLDFLVDFARYLHPALKAGPVDFLLAPEALGWILDSYEDRRKRTGEVTREQLAAFIRDKAGLRETPNLITHPCLGKGSDVIATRPGNITVGIGTPQDAQFVQVRSPYEDPNLVQFWMQMNMGTRVDDWNSKLFCFATGGTEYNQPISGLLGDYIA